MVYHHIPVMLTETIDALLVDPNGCYVDCTLGGGGHALAIAQRLSPRGRLVAIDCDPAAVANGREKLAAVSCSWDVVQANFADLRQILTNLAIPQVTGVLFDLGVSSYQLDTAERGFSYMHDAPLDMRMDPAQSLSAFDVVNYYPEAKLAEIIACYGEERWAKRIAHFIVRRRELGPIKTTGELVTVIKQAIPARARREGPHPAKRTFQAIRIEVNGELNVLPKALEDAVAVLSPGGRLCVITFHSLEDRICKHVFQELAQGCTCHPAPVCICGHKQVIRILGRARRPTPAEVQANSRARSAKLRVVEKL